MATIRKRTTKDGKTRYQAIIRLKGLPPVSQTFARKTDAKTWANQTEPEMSAGRYLKYTEGKKKTLSDAIDRYLADIMPRKSDEQQRSQTRQLEWWREEMGDLTLADVTSSRITEMRDSLARGMTQRGKKRAHGTVNRYLAALSHLLTVAVKEWEWLENNPAMRVAKLKEPPGRVRYLSDDERENLLAECQKSRQSLLYPLVLLAMTTGARKGELLNLRWENVDLDRKRIYLLHTKNDERRSAPVTGPAHECLVDLKKVRRIDTDLVFPHKTKAQPINPDTAFVEAVKRAKLEDFKFHDLRHTAASYLAQSGATLMDLAEILGHKTLQMVKRYAHLTEGHTGKVMERMTTEVFGESS